MQKKSIVGPILRCQICSYTKLAPIFSLGHQSRVHGHLTKSALAGPETKYPLNLCYCSQCGLIQLDYAVDPKVVFFPAYPYHSGTTNMLVKNFRSLADTAFKTYALAPNDLVIDIGSNDGTLLQGFREKGMRVLGIEPTDVAKTARKNGIPTIQQFFTKKTARNIVTKYGKAKVITATNVFAHINNLFEFLDGIKTVLTSDGVFVSESQYVMDIFKKIEIDTIYDEHLRYYTLKPLKKLFSLTGFTMTNAERIGAAGGSIRVYAMKGKKPVNKAVAALVADEEKAGIYDPKTYKEFAKRAIHAKHDLIALLIKCKKEGARIAGLGAPGRSNTLLGFTKIDNHLLDYLCERSDSPKIGLFSPNTHLPIVDEKKLLTDQPDYALVLSWHIGEELMKKVRALGYRGKFIMPLPAPRIVTKI